MVVVVVSNYLTRYWDILMILVISLHSEKWVVPLDPSSYALRLFRPGPGEIQSARTYQDFIRVRNQSKSIEAGKIFLVAQIPIPKDSTTIQYHAGRACFFHPWKEPNVIVYDFSQGKKPAKYKYKCSEGSVIVSAALGGGNRSGTLLVYCEFISPSRLRAVCYPLRAGNKLWTNHFTASSQLSYTDQILMKTNGTVTVIAVQNKLLVWKHEGKCLAERELVNQLKGSTNGLLCLSETKIYHITWTGEEKLCVDIYILRDLTYICGHQLKVPNPVRHVFGTFTNNKLYFTIASSLLSGVCSAWRLYCVDDNCPALIDQIEDFPTLDRVLHSRVVFYPHQGSTYVVGQTDFSKQPPTSFLEVYRRGASKGKMLKKQNGYLPRLELEGDSSTWNPLQGDNEYLTWQTTGKLKVFKFVTDQEEEED
ncbi:hypothetical protein BDZ91DRAFT_739493 [Kalaharituber pfeilii]|nr:hypothetical protein BDZ91DRAFT_739493 [Kalaharituber pfeilii]